VLKVPLPRRVTNVKAQRTEKGKRISWNAVFDCNGAAVAGYNIYRASSAAGPFSKINTALITDTVYFDTDSTEGIADGGGAGSGAAGYYAVTAVDSAGTESVQSLAVKPASAVSSAAGSAAGAMGCFIRTAGNPAARPYIIILLIAAIVVVLCGWRSRKVRTEC